VLKKNIGYIEN
jgi:hypothetical protein